MTDKLTRIGVLADFLDDVARFTKSPLMVPLVFLMVGTIGIVGGCYGILWPQKMMEANRRMRWPGSDPDTVKAFGCLGLVVGFLVLGFSGYLFLR